MLRRLLLATFLISSTPALAQTIPFVTRTPGAPPTTPIERFLGAAGIGPNASGDLAHQMGLGAMRIDVSWQHKNPAPGVYDWGGQEDTDQHVLDLKAQGFDVVLMVRNTPDWACVTTPYEFWTTGSNNLPLGERWVVTPAIDPVTGFASGYTIDMFSHADGSFVGQKVSTSCARLRMADPSAFGTFMRAFVERYSAPPFEVRAFQIGNEHIPESGHYPLDSPGDYAARWFVPGARAIHAVDDELLALNCWPNAATAVHFDAFDAVPGAVEELDVFVQHYGTPLKWQPIWDRYALLGKPNIPFWATEFGSASNTMQPWKIVHDYPQLLGLALAHGMQQDPGRHQVFWWPYGANTPLQGSRALANPQLGLLTSHGEQLRALHSLLYGPTLALEPGLRTAPDRSKADYAYAFRTARGVVVALGMKGWTGSGPLDVLLTDVDAGKVELARLVGPTGEILATLTPTEATPRGGTRLVVDTGLLTAGELAVYVELHLAGPPAQGLHEEHP